MLKEMLISFYEESLELCDMVVWHMYFMDIKRLIYVVLYDTMILHLLAAIFVMIMLHILFNVVIPWKVD